MRVVCLDGLAGSGKTTLAAALAGLRPDAAVLGTDEMLHGWRGLPELGGALLRLLRPMRAGEPGRWRRWDWIASSWADEVPQPPTGLLILEGVGSGSSEIRDLIGTLVWVGADDEVRLRRWLARDGEAMRPYWTDWLADEAEHHAEHDTRARADLVVDTSAW